MGLDLMIPKLIAFWQKRGIITSPNSLEKIEQVSKKLFLELPDDFKELYRWTNGMELLFPNEFDEEGFLFYPIKGLENANMAFGGFQLTTKENIFIFADYMHESWWYGCEVLSRENYVIGIIPSEGAFKPITHSLEAFIGLYFEGSPKLYDYS
ncbi:MAG: SMI1/KNR4 family protein [Bacteroidia bacterium]